MIRAMAYYMYNGRRMYVGVYTAWARKNRSLFEESNVASSIVRVTNCKSN